MRITDYLGLNLAEYTDAVDIEELNAIFTKLEDNVQDSNRHYIAALNLGVIELTGQGTYPLAYTDSEVFIFNSPSSFTKAQAGITLKLGTLSAIAVSFLTKVSAGDILVARFDQLENVFKVYSLQGGVAEVQAELDNVKNGYDFTGAISVQGSEVMTKVNGGHGSLYDADKLDGKEASEFYLKTENVEADTLDGYHASAFRKVADTVDATTLDGIDSTGFVKVGDYVASDVLAKVKTVDGSGSGLDSDTVDGLQASQFVRSDIADTMAGKLTITGDKIIAPAFACSDGGGSTNVDHLWHDDTTNTWHFCSDIGYKTEGNSVLRAGAVNLGGVQITVEV